MISRQTVLGLLDHYGFHRAAICRSGELPESIASHPAVAGLGRGSFVMAALSCFRREPDDLSRPGDPQGLIAPFARRNYYREAVRRLKEVVRELERISAEEPPMLTRREMRIFCNSRFPEKPLAAAAGLGFYGKNALLISPGLGSLFIIAGLFLPLDLEADIPPRDWLQYGRMCGSCRTCLEACPAGAIPEPGVVDQTRCLQSLASQAVPFTEEFCEIWSVRFYGCQTCQEVCPYNRNLSLETVTELGSLGPSVPLKRILTCPSGRLKELFRGTQLGLSWVDEEALFRNAVLAAAHRGDPFLLPELEALAADSSPIIKMSSKWALKRIRSRGMMLRTREESMKRFMDIFHEIALKKFGVERSDIKGRTEHFDEIMQETMRIFNRRLKTLIRRTTMQQESEVEGKQ